MMMCPSFFDGRRDGIGRVSGTFFEAANRRYGREPTVWSANEAPSGECKPPNRCFARDYAQMMWTASTSRVPTLVDGCPTLGMHIGLSPVARIIAARTRTSYAVLFYGVECWKPLRLRAKWGVSRASLLVFISEYTRRTFLEVNPWAANQPYAVLPLGMSVDTFDGSGAIHPVPRRYQPGGLKILCVGRMDKADSSGISDNELYKGFKPLIKAVGKISASGLNVSLDIVGDGDAKPDLESWLGTQPEARITTLLGRVSDESLAQAYRRCDVFCLPSEGEGFGLVFVEAMAYAKPCVCVGAGAAPEVVQDGVTGLVARPRDVDDLASKIASLAKDPDLRSQLGSAARQRYLDFYTREKFLARIDETLAILDKRP